MPYKVVKGFGGKKQVVFEDDNEVITQAELISTCACGKTFRITTEHKEGEDSMDAILKHMAECGKRIDTKLLNL